jgi:TonB family protein
MVQRQVSLLTASSLAFKKKELLNRITYLLKEDPMPKISKFTTTMALIVLLISGLALSMTTGSQEESPPLAPSVVQTIETNANTGSIRGNVVYKDKTITGAKVGLKGTSFYTYSDEKGNYVIRNVPPGEYTLEIENDDDAYGFYMFTDAIVKVNETTVSDFFFPKLDDEKQNTGKIAGQITNKDTGEPIEGANIFLHGTKLGVASDKGGNFFMINVPPGIYTLEAIYVGFKSVQIKDVKVSVNRTHHIELNLEPVVVLINGKNKQKSKSKQSKKPSPSPKKKNTQSQLGKQDEKIYEFYVISEKPRPEGGIEAIQMNAKSKGRGAKGTVIIEALVDENGEITKTRIKKSLNPDADTAAEEALKSVVWKAARQRDKNVAVWVSIPIEFK